MYNTCWLPDIPLQVPSFFLPQNLLYIMTNDSNSFIQDDN